MKSIERVVVLGANGTMGATSGAVFAGAGLRTVFLARTRQKAALGVAKAQKLLRTSSLDALMETGSYDDLERLVGDADLVFEALAEDYSVKRTLLSRVDHALRPGALVATVSSGLSIAQLCAGRSAQFSAAFMGIHFFNPPTLIAGCELVAHAGTSPEALATARDLLTRRLRRQVVETRDTPAFCGNRVGFKVLNEIAQLAEEHGVHYLESVLGPHTGRSMGPFATMDFVGLDVHAAIVDNLYRNTDDEAKPAFIVPDYLRAMIGKGRLGLKTRSAGGFYLSEGKGADARRLVFDIRHGNYRPVSEQTFQLSSTVAEVSRLIRSGRYEDSAQVIATAPGKDAELMRSVILGYVSYALGCVGTVVREARDVDRIMGFGFNWAPPTLWVDYFKPRTTVALLQQRGMHVPELLIQAAERNQRLFNEPHVDRGRFFFA